VVAATGEVGEEVVVALVAGALAEAVADLADLAEAQVVEAVRVVAGKKARQ
jgi:hypothetical protein